MTHNTTSESTENRHLGLIAPQSHVADLHRPTDSQADQETLTVRPMPFSKRTIDIVGAAVGLVLLAPGLMLVAAMIRLVSPGPAIYRQRRVGTGGREFTILKFRTMHPQNESESHRRYVGNLAKQNGSLRKLDDRSRLIWMGAFLRRSSIDELPQLVNVLRGEMSLIGPRPDVLAFDEYTPQQQRRFEVTPGISGLWQVSGKNRLTFEQMIALDIAYAERRSLLLDLKILLKTVPMILGMNR